MAKQIMNFESNYLEDVRKLFRYYRRLGEQAMDQLEPEQLFLAANDDSNSIAVIVGHLAGNMLSRWTDFLTTDGEKSWRDRDAEFETQFSSREELRKRWDEGWDCFLKALDQLEPADLERICYIRNEGHTVLEAINRQFGHYPYHVGQIVFAAKQLKAGPWKNLSIPKNQSGAFNAGKFSIDKRRKSFLDEEKY
jgi:uncharacterized damage-inducible protein DinB